MKTDKELINELESMYRQVAEENIGDTKSALQKIPLALETDSTERQTPPPRRPKTGIFLLSLFLIPLMGFFLWPQIYHEGLTKSGDKIYPVRTNKITGGKSYFYKDKWRSNPLPTARPVRSPITISMESPPPMIDDAEKVPLSTVPPSHEGRYTIQIKAIKDFKKVNDFLALLQKRGFKPFWEEVTIKNKGIWYRIFIGRFSDTSEATKYLNENKIAVSYPGSFVQKVSSNLS